MPILQTGILSKGFSLLELIVVLVILTFALSILSPLFSKSETLDLKAEVQRMVSIIRYLDDNATAHKQVYRLKFNFSQKLVQWEKPEGWKTHKFKYLQDVNLFSRGTINKGEVIIFFEPTGNTEAMKIHFGSQEQELTVFWQPVSGRVKILHGYQ
ncbi:MAG: type II secretion system GspH family protein [Candidatus Desulfofervidaceae bacterium]|nr:type II secretion system GspH family protein [Candidatus Desulfofervidaceae bacterium]